MWRRISDREIDEFLAREEQKRKSLLRPFLWASLWAGCLSYAYYMGFRGGARGFYVFAQHSRFTWITIVAGLITFVIVFTIISRRQRRGESFFARTDLALLCVECYGPATLVDYGICKCGARPEPYEFYQWDETADAPLTL